jgi:exodeoxyribonuclease VII small subunit
MSELAGMSFEAAMAELEEVVRKLESGSVALDETIALYERGAALKAHCDAKLRAAEEKVELIRARDGVAQGTSPAEGL